MNSFRVLDFGDIELDGFLDRQVSLCRDAHDQECLEGQDCVLEGVPEVGDQEYEHLVLGVDFKLL